MNKHLTDGQLRASLDGELDSDGLTHLEACSHCQTRQAALQTQTQAVTDKLSFLSSPTDTSSLSKPSATASAWHRFNQQKLIQEETSMFRKLFASPAIRYGVSIVLILTLVLFLS